MKTAQHAINQHPRDYRKHFNLQFKSTHHPCLHHQLTKRCIGKTSELPLLLHFSQLLAFTEKKMSRSHPQAEEIHKEHWLQYLCYLPRQFYSVDRQHTSSIPSSEGSLRRYKLTMSVHTAFAFCLFVDFFVNVFKPQLSVVT